jgi:hypothetical protein
MRARPSLARRAANRRVDAAVSNARVSDRPIYVQTVTYQVYINRTYTTRENAHRA